MRFIYHWDLAFASGVNYTVIVDTILDVINFSQTNFKFELALIITLILQTQQLTKRTSLYPNKLDTAMLMILFIAIKFVNFFFLPKVRKQIYLKLTVTASEMLC